MPLSMDLDDLRCDDRGDGEPVLVLHGGGGPRTVAGLAAALAGDHRVLLPTHPGFAGTPLPQGELSVAALAATYLELLAREGLRDVLVVGSSVGGWVAAEMALQDADGRVGAVALLDAVGVEVPGEPIADVRRLTPEQLAAAAFADPAAGAGAPPPDPADIAALVAYAGDPWMHDPRLLERLGGASVPALVLRGRADDIVTPAYGRALAAALPGARFVEVDAAGHLPHLEQPDAVLAQVRAFATEAGGRTTA